MIGIILTISFSVLQIIALEMNPAEVNTENVFLPFSVSETALFVLIFCLTRTVISRTKSYSKKQIILPALLGALFSFFMAAGHSFSDYGNLSEITLSNGAAAETVIYLFGHAVFFYVCIQSIISAVEKISFIGDSASVKWKPADSYLRLLGNKPFLITALTMTVFALPNMIISYPGVMTGDTYFQIAQAYGIEYRSTSSYMPTPAELYKTVGGETFRIDTKLTNYHPVLHTLLLKGCIETGRKVFHSENTGLFLLVILQNFLLIGAVSYSVYKFRRDYDLAPVWCFAFLIYFCLHPSISAHMIDVSKEGVYIPFLIISVLEIASLVKNHGYLSGRDLFLSIAGILGVILFRNEGKFIIGGSFLILFLFLKGKRKICLVFFLGTVLFSVVYESFLLPAFNVAPGSIREVLSVPFQQTARLVRDDPAAITEEDREAIDAVLDFEKIGKVYEPEKSDVVKATYRNSADSEDLKNYFISWFRLLLKRPKIYVLATMNNYYKYFYPSSAYPTYYAYETGTSNMNRVNNNIPELDFHFSLPKQLKSLRTFYQDKKDMITSKPFIRGIWVSAYYVWALFIYIVHSAANGHGKKVLLAVPMMIQILIFITGPTNGNYHRYILLLKAALPVILFSGAGWGNEVCGRKSEEITPDVSAV